MTCSTDEQDFPIGGPGEHWYRVAKGAYQTFCGDKNRYLTQARLWLEECDIAFVEIAWNLVHMEKENAADA